MNAPARQIGITSAFAGLLMLLYGWYNGGPLGVSKSELYNSAVDVFRWMLRLGGASLLLTSAMCFLGLRGGLLLDFIVTGLCGAIMLGVGAIGLFAGGAPGLQDILVLVFGGVFIRAAWGSWSMYSRPEAGGVSPVEPVIEPVHPASIHPHSLPAEGEPVPPDGYLAALSHEKEEPPSASYE